MPDLLLPALLAGSAAAAVPTVLTFDNGEFNAPLYTPRWNGRWKQPSVAQEIATSVARVLGENPIVYTYLPPGQRVARPGQAYAVRPVKPGCAGPADDPADACWCSPADNCWGDLQPSWYSAASTSLFLTAQTVRKTLREAGDGPRVEVHFTDLFEEDPSAADDPADTDRCVTAAGVKRALQALLQTGDDAHLDHLAVGLLRATVDPPPPGPSWGYTYGLVPDEGGRCHSGAKTGPWSAERGPITMSMAMIVLGIDTAEQHPSVAALLDGLVHQLDTGPLELRLVRLREPPAVGVLERVIEPGEANPLAIPPIGPQSGVPCGTVTGAVALVSGAAPVGVREATGRCDGSVEVAFAPRALLRSFARQAGIDPTVGTIELTGAVELQGDAGPLREAFGALAAVGTSDRPLPLWGALEDALALAEPPGPSRPWRPWTRRVEIRSLRVTDLDERPWLVAIAGGAIVGLLAGYATSQLARGWHANRALRRHWQRSLGPGTDPLVQRPVAVVIGRAQEEVARGWPFRLLLGVVAAGAALASTAWIVLVAWRVLLG